MQIFISRIRFWLRFISRRFEMFDTNIQSLILIWIGSIAAVQGFTEKLKWLYRKADDRVKKILNYINSFVVSLVVCALFLFLTNTFSVKGVFLYAIPIWLAASGIYDAYRSKSK